MPRATANLTSGVNVVETPVLNEMGISQCNLIRYKPDGKYVLVEKLGGWTKFFGNQITSPIRALWAWEDTNSQARLAYGTQNNANYQAQLGVIASGVQTNITPRAITDNIAPAASSTMGDSIITITDADVVNVTNYDAVYIPAHISIGGVILFGLYQCDPDGHAGTTTYTVQAHDILGNPLPASATSTSATVAKFSTTSGSNQATVTLNNHGYVAGDTYPVLIPTTVGGTTFYGNYIVLSVTDANNFVITTTNTATATATGFINGGNARYVYSFGIGAIPAGTGYGIGGYGRGGYGSGTAVIPSTGTAINATDWTLDNWGQILIACPITTPVVLNTTATSGTGTTATVTYSQSYTVDPGEEVVISGVAPNAYNGTHAVTASTANSVSFASTATGSQTQAGTILVEETSFQPIYMWDPLSGSPTATVISQAPPVNDGCFVAMPQRQIIAWGSTFTGIQDPLLIRWCDVNNFGVWIAQTINQAGSYRIPKGSRIVGAIQGPQQGLIWTDIGVWAMQYINQPYIYSFNEIGTGCGLIARKAAASLNGVVYWMGPSQFFMISDEGVTPLPCPIWDVVFQNMDQNNLSKIRIAVNSRFNEVAWYYPSANGGGEVDSYVKFNVLLGDNGWDYGSLPRSAWVDQSVLGPPIGSDPKSLYIYQHETAPDADGQVLPASFRTGYFALSNADLKTFVDQIWPDLKFGYYSGMQNATVNLTFYVADYPSQTPRSYGPFPMTTASTFITPRFRGRLVALELANQDVGTWWRLGGIRYRYAEDGKF